MAAGEQQEVAGRGKKLASKAEIAAKHAAFVDRPPGGEGVQPLNPGFFKVQRMRFSKLAQSRGNKEVRQK